jgi:cbb3-type cytochrome c oxidase subunit I
MLNFTKKTNSASLAFLIAGAFWFMFGAFYGIVSAIHLVAPEFFNNMQTFVFGRTRPMHVNTMIYGFVSCTLVGFALYAVPALLKTRLWSERLGWFSFVCWNITVASGVTFLYGYSQGREYAEYVTTFDWFLVVAMVGLLLNMVMTVLRRRENTLYVSVWYIFGMLLWTSAVYPIGNVMWTSAGALPGMLDSIFLWYYGHNLVGLLLTPLALAAAYFVVPRVTKTPIYSHTLSLVGFFSLVAIYSHIGGHHLLQAPIPAWLKNVSVVDSIMMFIPVFVVLTNLWMTARGKFGMLWNDLPGRFVLVGTLWYLVTCTQGPLQSLPDVQKVTHFTNWVIGHSHIAVLGFSGFIAIGAMYHVLPMVTGREIYSRRLMNIQFGLVLFGLMGFFLVLTTAGLIQGQSWLNGEGVYKTLPQIRPYMVLRATLGVLIIIGTVIGFYNVIMTVFRGVRIAAPAPEGGANQ